MKNYIIIGLAFALVVGVLYSYAANMRDQRDRKAEKLTAAEEKIETMTTLAQAQEQAIVKLQAKERQNEDAQQKIKNTIRTSPASDDAAAAPVLARTLDELRVFQGR